MIFPFGFIPRLVYPFICLIVNKAAVNTGVQISLQDPAVSFFGYIPRSGIVGLLGSFMVNSLRNLHTVFYSGCASLHSHKWYIRAPSSPHPCQLLLSIEYKNRHPDRYEVTVILWFWFVFSWWLVTLRNFSHTWWPSICQLWKNICFFCPLFSWFVSLLLSFVNSLRISDIDNLSDKWFANIYSHLWLAFSFCWCIEAF